MKQDRLVTAEQKPWEQEPDEVCWEEGGVPCLIRRQPSLLSLCGYAAVTKEHPWYGLGIFDVDVEVHGGVTYADAIEGQSEDLWWLGFDCGHDIDLVPGLIGSPFESIITGKPVYRDIHYVTRQVQHLAVQIKAAEKG